MAISSVGGAAPVDTGGVRQATGGSETELVQGAATASPEEAIEQEAARVAALAAGAGNATGATTGDGNLTAGGDGNLTKETTTEEAKPKTLAEVPAEQITAIKENLAKSGGIYADPRYETAALEFETLGAVTAETKAATAKAFGVPEATVDAFIEGEVAKRALATQQAGQPTAAQVAIGEAVLRVVPDQAAYESLMAWGKEGENVSTAEKTAFDAALDRGDTATTEALLRAFNARYTAAGNGPGPRDITREGGVGGTGGEPGYNSSAEMQADMNNPKYASDSAFRATVERKVAASKF